MRMNDREWVHYLENRINKIEDNLIVTDSRSFISRNDLESIKAREAKMRREDNSLKPSLDHIQLDIDIAEAELRNLKRLRRFSKIILPASAVGILTGIQFYSIAPLIIVPFVIMCAFLFLWGMGLLWARFNPDAPVNEQTFIKQQFKIDELRRQYNKAVLEHDYND